METIKSYTDLEQSKKLAEFLPLESADMHSEAIEIDGDMVFVVVCGLGDKNKSNYGSPVWSLAALLKTLNFPSLTQNKEDEWEVCVFDHDNDDYIEKTASNPIDACYEMIIKLNKLNLL